MNFLRYSCFNNLKNKKKLGIHSDFIPGVCIRIKGNIFFLKFIDLTIIQSSDFFGVISTINQIVPSAD